MRIGRKVGVRIGLLAVAGMLAAVAGYVVAVVPPNEAGFYPRCSLYQVTGLHCPGCGTTRALHALLNGRIEQAVAYNPLVLGLVPVAIGFAVSKRLRATGVSRTNYPPAVVWLLAVLLVTFFVLRNVPVYPFTLLAPHELAP